MGCGVSRFDENGMVLPLKTRPLLLFRLEEFKKRRHPQAVKDSGSSKKELLMDHKGEDDNHVASIKQALAKQYEKDSSSLADDAGSCVTSEEGSKGGLTEKEYFSDGAEAKKEVKSLGNNEGEEHDHEGKLIEPLAKDNINHDDDEEEEENDGRMIGHHEDDSAFPGSPSFRVYFAHDNKGDNKIEDGDDDLRKAAPIDDDPKPLKCQQVPLSQEVKKEKKRIRSFKKVLPSGKQAKNLFNVRSCMSTHANHDRAHLLAAKAHA